MNAIEESLDQADSTVLRRRAPQRGEGVDLGEVRISQRRIRNDIIGVRIVGAETAAVCVSPFQSVHALAVD
jgi:hypothetical protein